MEENPTTLPAEWRNSSNLTRKEGSICSIESCEKRKRRACEYTCLYESLKTSIDYLYDFCLMQRSVAGCKEVALHLKSSVSDFDQLIKSISIEDEFAQNTSERTNVAWEIRRTNTSPTYILQTQIDTHQSESDENKVADLPNSSSEDDNDWKVVHRRRRSGSSVAASVPDEQHIARDENEVLNDSGDNEASGGSHTSDSNKQTVYDRLYSLAVKGRETPPSTSPTLQHHCSSSRTLDPVRLKCPRSAMDLPQTRSSMAKIACSREKLWKQREMKLADIIRERKRQDRKAKLEQRSVARCGINFADPDAVKKSAQELSLKKKQLRDTLSAADARSLGSIHEVTEDPDGVPSDPIPSNMLPDETAWIRPSTLPLPPASWHGLPADVQSSAEWRAMTEEEESLACEERSLTREMENEELMSIDDELERLGLSNADCFENEEKIALEVVEKAEVQPSSTQRGAHKTTKPETIAEVKFVTWSQIVSQPFTGQIRQPGDDVAKHEKLSSPSRRKSTAEISRLMLERQQRAEDLRIKLMKEKGKRLSELSKKIDEIRARQVEIREKKLAMYNASMEKHSENRSKNLAEIVRKAKDDDQKVHEAHFCAAVQEEMSVIDRQRRELLREAEIERRRLQIADERQKRYEEKMAKEAAVEERRKAAEVERAAQLQAQAAAKLARKAKFEAYREREREERKRAREERVEYLKAIESEKRTEELRNLQNKLDSSSRRYEQNLEIVRAKAHELGSSALARWSALANASEWPSQSTSKAWTCIRCNVHLSSELEIMAHVVGQRHLEACKMKALDVTHHKLAMELCESVFEADSATTSLTNSIVIDEKPDKRKVQKVKSKFIQRIKKCEEAFAKSTTTLNRPEVKDRGLRELQAALGSPRDPRKVSHKVSEMAGRLCTERPLVEQFFASGLAVTIANKIPTMSVSDTVESRLQAKLFDLLRALCSEHIAAAKQLFFCTPLPLWVAEQLVSYFKTGTTAPLEQFLGCFRMMLTAADQAKPECGIDPAELGIRLDLLTSYMVALNIMPLIPSMVQKLFSISDFAPLKSVAYFFAILSEMGDSPAILAFLAEFLDPLLYGVIDYVKNESANELQRHSLTSHHDPPKQLCRIALSCTAQMREPHFKEIFGSSETRAFRFCLIASECVRLPLPVNQDTKKKSFSKTAAKTDLEELKLGGIALAGRFASISSSHQLLCTLGCSRSLLATICQLKKQYILTHANVVLPTIIRISVFFPTAADLVAQDFDLKAIVAFFDHAIQSPSKQFFLKAMLREDQWQPAARFYDSKLALCSAEESPPSLPASA